MRTLPPEKEREINVAVSRWLKGQGITQRMAAERLGVSTNAVSRQISTRHFSKNSARRWSEAFGFNEHYLLTGKGPLLDRRERYSNMALENDNLRSIVKSQQSTIADLQKRISELESDRRRLSIA